MSESKAERHKRLQTEGAERLREWCKEERGRAKNLATFLGVTSASFAFWDRVMAERLGEVANYTGIPRELLRPDLFDPPEDPKQLENSDAA